MTALSTAQVSTVAPDPRVAVAGAELASRGDWAGAGTDGAHAWALCSGSGTTPYEVSADLLDLATSCSCPSRRFPCKHAVALLYRVADGRVPTGGAPDWAARWRDRRATRGATTGPDDRPGAARRREQSAARRAEERAQKVDGGATELQTWLEDVVRVGLAAVRGQGPERFDTAAARMVDAQAPGLADRVRHLCRLTTAEDSDWSARTLDLVGSTALLLKAWRSRDALDPTTRAQVEVRIGLPTPEPTRSLPDTWTVLGSEVRRQDRLTTAQQWLLGRQSGLLVTLLSHAGPGRSPDTGLPDGDTTAELAVGEGALPLRAWVRSQGPTAPATVPALPDDWTAALVGYRSLLGQDPWCDAAVVGCRCAALLPGEPWRLRDQGGATVALRGEPTRLWRALARTGGRPTAVVGEWDGWALLPLGVEDEHGAWTVLR